MKTHQRPLWIIIFAILLASIAIRAKGQGFSVGDRFNARVSVERTDLSDHSELSTRGDVGLKTQQVISGASESAQSNTIDPTGALPKAPYPRALPVPAAPVQTLRVPAQNPITRRARPKYAFLAAELAQFDADSDPDGWLAKVFLLGSDDEPVIVRRASAKFELIPRLPTHEFTGYTNANVKSITWNMPLKFDEDGSATVRLKLKTPIRPLVGWAATSHPAVGSAGGFFSSRRGIIRHTVPQFESRTALTDSLRRGGASQYLGVASFAQLKMRVSVPGEGTFDTVAPVSLRPSVLVDTRWPYQ